MEPEKFGDEARPEDWLAALHMVAAELGGIRQVLWGLFWLALIALALGAYVVVRGM